MRLELGWLIALCAVSAVACDGSPDSLKEQDEAIVSLDPEFCPAYVHSSLFRPRARQVVVGPSDNWIAAIEGAQPGTEVLLRDGEYRTGGKYAIRIRDEVTVRGQSGDRSRVIIRGAGLQTPSEGLYVTGRNVTIADLSVTGMRNYAVSIKGELGAQAPNLYNLSLYDVGTKLVKLSPGGAANGVIACSSIGYNHVRGDYIASADLHQAINWVIRDNVLFGVWGDGTGCAVDENCGSYDPGRALLIWNHSRGTVIERNLFVNNYRDISLGLDTGHDGGIIRNNFILRTRRGGPMNIEARNTTNLLVAHNTVRRVDADFAMTLHQSTNIRVLNNLFSTGLQNRGGSTFEARGNIFDARDGDFAALEDFHLAAGGRALGHAVALTEVPTDMDGDARGAVRDVGADQLSGVATQQPPPVGPPASEPPPATVDFCPPYTRSPVFRARTRTVVVGPGDNWIGAIEGASPGTEVLLRDGTYRLGSKARIRIGSEVTVRGQSGDRERVQIVGQGYGPDAEALYVVGRNVDIADLSVSRVRSFAVSLKGELGAQAPHIYNVHLFDTGKQQIKLSPGASANGVIACSSIGFSPGAVRGDYIDAIDLHNAIDWVIRDNYIYNIWGEGNGCNVDADCGTYYSGPAILVWNNSRGTVVERNTIVDSFRGVAFGLGSGHEGGVIRNNFFYRTRTGGDIGLELRTANDVTVAHNTVRAGDGRTAMHLLNSRGVRLLNNLLSGPIQDRGGNQFDSRGNLLDARDGDFIAPDDVHLRAGSHALGRGVAVDDVPTDIDGEARGSVRDVGADQVPR